MRKLVRALVILGVWLVGTVGVAETTLHLLGSWPHVSWEWQLEAPQRVPDPHTLLIDPRFTRDASYEVATDSEVVVALGDSFTAGFHVGADQAWPALAEQRLSTPERPVAVLNFGLANSGTQQQARLLEDHVLPRLSPSVVVWALYANDLPDDALMNTYSLAEGALVPLDGRDHWIYRRVQLWRRLPLPGFLRSRSAILRHLASRWENAQRRQAAPSDPVLVLPALIRRVERAVQRSGGRLILVQIPPHAAVGDTPMVEHPLLAAHRQLTELLRPWPVHRLPELALNDQHYLSASDDSLPLGSRHFSHRGHQRLAELVVGALSHGR